MSTAVCRVCLAGGDVRMHSVQDIKLLDIFEKLTDTKVHIIIICLKMYLHTHTHIIVYTCFLSALDTLILFLQDALKLCFKPNYILDNVYIVMLVMCV